MNARTKRPETRVGLFEAISRDVNKILGEMPTHTKIFVDSGGGGLRIEGELDQHLRAIVDDRIKPRLSRLAALSPLVVEGEVEEILRLELYGGSGHAYVELCNIRGEREHVTTFFAKSRPMARYFDSWCVARSDSTLSDTPWDEARKSRRLVDGPLGKELIDQGINRAIDIVVAAGGSTTNSCEGHPWGAYLSFLDPEGRIAPVFAKMGWSLETRNGPTIARMPATMHVLERDNMWRAVCAELERALELEEVPVARL